MTPLDVLSPAGILAWSLFLTYVLLTVLSTVLVLSIRKGLLYWPSLVVLATLLGLRSLYGALASFPPSSAWWVALHDWLPTLLLNLLSIGGLVWGITIIWMQNRIGDHGIVDADLHVHHLSPHEAREAAGRALVRAADVEQEHARAQDVERQQAGRQEKAREREEQDQEGTS